MNPLKHHLLFGLALLIVFLQIGCTTTSKINGETAEVVRDCTGTYLRTAEKKDYLVCNAVMIEKFAFGSKISAVWQKTDSCPDLDGKVVCMMYHENEGKIRINRVKGL